ncbi:hypothetical protein DAETH_38350 (plasmid) [Deinococcus aetherius]|uniref:3-carboxymuconate cyclase n=1 Tax=Deinococcus aetherius TaxID=200252 RepID=A0ABM8AJ87_9DEIO|nr:lactonase family protein [Deinococcus aetherius]BDP43866.1 hypothetical protein DAETH_38350 [Deinococcus aetherius]
MSSFLKAPLAALLTVSLAACGTLTTPGANYAGHLFAMTNAAGANAIVHYGRSEDGRLTRLGETPTGGQGVGGRLVVDPGKEGVDPLFSSDSVVLSTDHTRLFAVNAGSGTVSSFRVGADGNLTLVGTSPTGGTVPTSLALHGDVLYVGHARAGDGGVQLTGFRVGANGSLGPIAGARYATSGTTLVSQILFSPDGALLEVSELNTGKVSVYPVNADGTLGTPNVNASAGQAPFGAAFVNGRVLLVSEAGSGAVSSYNVASSGALTPIQATVVNGQKATCWLTLTPDGRFLYASNTSSGNVSVYTVTPAGGLNLVSAAEAYRAPGGFADVGGNPSSGPVDAVVSADGKYFYQQYSGLGVVGAYRVGSDGRLSAVEGGDGTGLPALGTEGLAGY